MIRIIILSQAVIMLLSSIVWFIKDDNEKWFERWVMGLILFGIYGIMKHIQKPNDE